MAVAVDHPVLGRTTQVGLPIELSATPAEIRTAPPLLGEHADEILAELGYSAADIAALSGPPRRDLRPAQSSWRRNESHDSPAIDGDQRDVRDDRADDVARRQPERECPRRRPEADRQVRRDRREHAEHPDHDERRDADARPRPAPSGSACCRGT